MGLDVCVNVTPEQVLSNEFLNEEEKALLPLFREACAVCHLCPTDTLSTRPGFYHGVHQVREAYRKTKARALGLDPDDARVDEALEKSHLDNHGDCDGWYLPENFETPIWVNEELSIGSSQRLLRELLEIDVATLDEEDRRPYFALLAPAIASVVSYEPICFC